MLELPEVETVRRGLEKYVVGLTIDKIDIFHFGIFEGEIGLLYDENTPESLNEAIEKFEKILRSAQDDSMERACVEQAEKFSEKEFDRKIKKIVENA